MTRTTTRGLLVRQDGMTLDEANVIASDLASGCDGDVLDWLRDIFECDGTNNEAKMAAILHGMILANRTED